jgi:transketolase
VSFQPSDLDRLSIDTVRTLSIDAIQKARSGHPGMPLGAAPMGYVLWQRHHRFDPEAPDWPDRDRFVLSGGHGSMLQYALLHLYGYAVSLEDLKNFRQWGARTPGHPEAGHTPGVEVTTGPLGQGAANSVGLAAAEAHLAARFNRGDHEVVNHRTWAIVTDGDLMEGVCHEAAALAGHLGLHKLTWLYDSNDVTLDGPAKMHMSEDPSARFAALGWHVQTVADGDRDLPALDAALEAARAETTRPSLIVVKTTIGFGSPNKAGTAASHGAPLGEEEVAATKRALGRDPEAHFDVPAGVREHCAAGASRGRDAHAAWRETFASWSEAHPELRAEWDQGLTGELPPGWDEELPSFGPDTKPPTRGVSGKVLNALAARIPALVGGDADLSCSTKSSIAGTPDFHARTPEGRNLRYGVREHAMTALANGLAHHGGLRPFVSTFFVFADYMRPSLRLAALDRLPVIAVWTHDSIGVGEDGPTHQPIEHLASLRCMPNFTVIRPGDAGETVEAWKCALRRQDGPTGLVLTRQDVPTLDRTRLAPASGVARGGYILQREEGEAPRLVLIASGSELGLAVEAAAVLRGEGVPTRVVSLPSWEIFSEQDAAYRDEVLPPAVKARLAIEAGTSFGWERWVGERGAVCGIDRFGASAPGSENFVRFGFTKDAVCQQARALLERLEG